MSQKSQSHEQPNAKNAPMSERSKQNPPVPDVSPDDPFPVTPEGTGKPGQQQK